VLIYLVRHGQTLFGDDGLYLRDAGLTDLGRQQARLVATHLVAVSFDAAFTSNLKRACETAREFERLTGMRARVVPDLAEIEAGDIYNADPSVKAAIINAEWDTGFEQFGGESIPVFTERVARGLGILLQTAEEEGARRAVLFTHGGVASAIIHAVADQPPSIYTRPHVPNCAYAVLDTAAGGELPPDGWETAHLGNCVT